jgi:putative flippase GtrA
MLAKLRSHGRTPIRFLLVGALNTFAGLTVIYALKWTLGVHDLAANVCGYAVGLTISYFLNARWTFAYRGAHGPAAPRFALTVAAAYLANLATVSVAIYGLGLNGYLAQALGILPYTVVNYFGCKLFVFADRAGPQPAGPPTPSVR